jgi:hypothetical protein
MLRDDREQFLESKNTTLFAMVRRLGVRVS